MQKAQPDENSLEIKLVMCADSAAGKTWLRERYTSNKFNPDSIKDIGGLCYTAKTVTVYGKKVLVRVFDIYGVLGFTSIHKLHCENAHGILLIYDITYRRTFDELYARWIKDISDYFPNIVKMLIGAKCDLESARKVSTEEAATFARKYSKRE